jgi:hypothetical protein
MRNFLTTGLLAGAALGSVVLMAGTAGAVPLSSVLTGGSTFLSDDSAESLIKGANNTGGATIVEAGDRLRGTFTLNQVSVNGGPVTLIGGNSGINELTGIFDITITEKVTFGTNFSSGGTCTSAFCFKFAPTASFASEAILSGFTNTAGAMMALFEDSANDYDRQLATIAQVEASATGGSAFWLFGFDDATDFWNANADSDNIAIAGVLPALSQFGNVNAGLSLIDGGSGPEILDDARSCIDRTLPGLTGVTNVDVCGTGGLLSKGPTGALDSIATPYDSLDNVDFSITTIPEPTTLALLGIGLLGLGIASRRRRTA